MSSQKLSEAKTLAKFFTEACQAYAPRRAFTYRPMFRTLSWTYREIWNHAVAFANISEEYGIQKGDRVILIAANSPFWVAAFFGIQLRGAIAIPLSPDSQPAFVQKIIAQTEAKLLIKNRFTLLEHTQIPSLHIEDIAKPEKETSIPRPDISEHDLAEIVYTSGTTGEPKGVMLTHKNLLSNVAASRKAIPVAHTMRFCSILPLFHMFEQTGGMLVPLSAGAQVSYATSLNPNHLKRIFQDDKINRMLAVPEFLRLIALRIQEKATEERKLLQLPMLLRLARLFPFMALRRTLFSRLHQTIGWNMHTIVSGGAPLEKEIGKFWESVGISLLQGYGLTETSPVLTANRYHERNLESVGKPFEGVSVKIAQDGEILAKGPNVFGGYWRNAEKTKEVFTEDGWFKTGDMGFFDTSGNLHIKGRKKFMIVLPSGEKVHAEDIEAELNREHGVSDSTVLGLKQHKGEPASPKLQRGEQVYAVLLLDSEKNPNAGKIIEHANQRLTAHQRIQGFSVWPLPDFPRTSTRKVKKPEVQAWMEAELQGKQQPLPSPVSAPKLERIIAQVLEVSPQELQDEKRLVADFNLDSLGRIELVARIENELSILIDEAQIVQETTIKDLKALVAEQKQQQIRHPFHAYPFSRQARFIRSILQPIFLKIAVEPFAPVDRYGFENLKEIRHPVFFFSNHLSAADAPVLYRALPAYIRQRLAAASASDIFYESEIRWINASRKLLELLFPIFPLIRYGGQTRSSFEYIARIVDRGFSVLLFPEGKSSRTGQLQPFKQGAGILGVEMQIPIVPVRISGTEHILPIGPESAPPRLRLPFFHKVAVTFGKPFVLDPNMDYREATAYIEQKIKEI